ncbi:cytochrome P450 77A3 [Andrographis paniculata]|uniref:cytochrome P450 77A3 n=1 Tax=Andrographis paniculata TaxID=175694 RepID=UPI0021E7154E|nr:cytochrome P450 77A3 [Andrographis paniculata]
MAFLLDALLFSLAVIFLRLWWRRRSPPEGLPPGPPGWPVVGNLFQAILQRRPFIFVVRDLRAKYGPIFTMRMGQRTMVIVSGADLIHEALVKRGAAVASRPPDSPIRLIFSVGKCAINSAEYGPLWRSLRRNFVTEMINPKRIKECRWIRNWAVEDHVRRLREEASRNGYVAVMSGCRLTICSILICLCFGAKIPEDRIRIIESVLKDVMMMTTPKLPDFLPVLTPLFRRQVEAAKDLRRKQLDCLVPLIRHRKTFVENRSPNGTEFFEMASPIGAAYVDSLFDLAPPEKGKLGEEEIVTLCSEAINAGTDTSATTLEWAMLHLVQNPEIQEKLYGEIVECVGEHGTVTEVEVEKMPYLSAVVKETFRRHPPSHFLLSHAATEKMELGGYTIPPNVSVEFYTAWLTEDPGAWRNPSEFQPERFLSGDGAEVDLTGMRGVKMLPFGAGRRICPAWSLGTLHVSLLLARMVQAFKWVPDPDNLPDSTETFAFTVVMKNPLKARILPRGGPGKDSNDFI